MVLKIFQFSVIRILHPGLPLCVGEGEMRQKGGRDKEQREICADNAHEGVYALVNVI